MLLLLGDMFRWVVSIFAPAWRAREEVEELLTAPGILDVHKSGIRFIANNAWKTEMEFLGTDLGDSWACAMTEALKWNTRLKRLEIHHGRISANGAEALAAALKRNTSVATLCLHCNAIGPDGAVAFADMFRHNTSITHLSLGDNAIGDDGALALATVLGQGNSTLQGLWIWKNGLTDKAAMALAGMLTRNHTLTQLGVQDNCIGPEGGEALGTALGSNDSLQLLWLHKNATATAHAFGAALPAGRRIDTGDWSEDDTGKAAFMEARRMR